MMKSLIAKLRWLLLICISPTLLAAPGDLDPDFDVIPLSSGHVNSIVEQEDGKIVAGGNFTYVNGVSHFHLTRLNQDGTLDSGFEEGRDVLNQFESAVVRVIRVQQDGKILVGGEFKSQDGTLKGIIRLNADGSVDSTFSVPAFTLSQYSSPVVNAIAIQSDGRILIGGDFLTINGTEKKHFVRLNTNGSLDGSFNLQTSAVVTVIEPEASGSWIVGGSFIQIGTHSIKRLARLRANGTIDTGFTPENDISTIRPISTVACKPDGEIIYGGYALSAGSNTAFVSRILPNGTFDQSFDQYSGGNQRRTLKVLALQDGSIIKATDGTRSANVIDILGSTVPTLELLNSYGETSHLNIPRLQNEARDVIRLSNGNLLVAGTFYSAEDKLHMGIVVLDQENANLPHSSFTCNIANAIEQGNSSQKKINGFTKTDDGRMLIMGAFVALGSTERNQLAYKMGALDSDSTVLGSFNVPNVHNGLREWTTLGTQINGKLIAVGTGEGVINSIFRRFNLDGSVDASFFLSEYQSPNSGLQVATWNSVTSFIVNKDDSITAVISKSKINRLLPDATVDRVLASSVYGDVSRFKRLENGKIIAASSNMIWKMRGQDASIDAFFNPVTVNGSVNVIVELPGERLIIAGDFTSVNGQPCGRIARLLADGSLDHTFEVGAGADATIHDLCIREDGEIFLAGEFQTFNGNAQAYLVQIGKNGDVRPTFTGELGPDNKCFAVTLAEPKKLLVGGNFSRFNGAECRHLASVELAPLIPVIELQSPQGFAAIQTTSSHVLLSWNSVLQAEGYIIQRKSSADDNWETLSALSADSKSYLDEDVERNSTYQYRVIPWSSSGKSPVPVVVNITVGNEPNLAGAVLAGKNLDLWTAASAQVMLRQQDGKIVIVGDFTHVNQSARSQLARLNVDGTLDATFTPPPISGGMIKTAALQADGKLIIGGDFVSLGGQSFRALARLNVDGSLDPTFSVASQSMKSVDCLVVDSSSRVLVAGEGWPKLHPDFDYPALTTIPSIYGIVRLSPNGLFDSDFRVCLLNSRVNKMIYDQNNKLLAAGEFNHASNGDQGTSGTSTGIVRIDEDGTIDGDFKVVLTSSRVDNQLLPNPRAISSMRVLANGKILVGGNFEAHDVTGTAERIIILNEDGTKASSFENASAASHCINDALPLSDGAIVVTGLFREYAGESKNGLALLNADGGLNGNEDISLFPVKGVALLKISETEFLLSGYFNHVNGQQRSSLVRIAVAENGSMTHSVFTHLSKPGTVHSLTAMSNGGTLVTGEFTSIGSASRVGLAKLTAEDEVDVSFAVSTLLEGRVYEAQVDGQGRIWLGGHFALKGQTNSQIVGRLLPNGERDASYSATLGYYGNVNALKVNLDNSLIIGGEFYLSSDPPGGLQIVPGAGVIHIGQGKLKIAHINESGASIGTLSSQNLGVTNGLARDASNHLLVASSYSINGQDALAKYDAGYSRVTAFAPVFNHDVKSLFVDSAGRYLVAGYFSSVSGTPRHGIARLTSNGDLDGDFENSLIKGSLVDRVIGSSDHAGLFLIGDLKQSRSSNSVSLVRVSVDGVKDSMFDIGHFSEVLNTGVVSHNRLLIGGNFTSLGGQSVTSLARIRLQNVGSTPIANPVLSLGSIGLSTASFTWTSVGGSLGYLLERSPSDENNWVVLNSGNLTATAYTDSFTSPGVQWKYRLRAFNSVGYSAYSNEIVVTTPSTYNLWLAERSLDAGSLPHEDPDNDGISLFEEFARGLSPTAKDDPVSATLNSSGDTLTLTYFRAQPSLHYEVVASDNMTDWNTNGVDQGGDGPWVTATIPVSGDTRKFLRLKISTQAPAP